MFATKTIALKNGLTVLLQENHARPLVTLDYWVRAGSADEPPALNGASHFLEHMLFKGTEQYGPSELDRVIEGIGGVWNAGTSQDFTDYHVSVASDYLTTAAEALYDMIAHAKIDPQEVDRERRVIIEEYQRKQDNPGSLLGEQLYSESFESGPYRATVLGTTQSLTGIDAARLRDYYDRHYAPRNCLLVVAGDVTEETLLPVLIRTFVDDDREYCPMLAAPADTRRAQSIQRVIHRDVKETYLGLAFPAPAIAEKNDVYAMDLLSVIMGDGRTSRLYQRLRDQDRLVSTIGASYSTQRYPGLFCISATMSAANVSAVRAAIAEEILKIGRKTDSSELARAKRKIRASLLYAAETNLGRAQMIGYNYIISGSQDFLTTYMDKVEMVTTRDVERVARQYLQPGAGVEVLIEKPH